MGTLQVIYRPNPNPNPNPNQTLCNKVKRFTSFVIVWTCTTSIIHVQCIMYMHVCMCMCYVHVCMCMSIYVPTYVLIHHEPTHDHVHNALHRHNVGTPHRYCIGTAWVLSGHYIGTAWVHTTFAVTLKPYKHDTPTSTDPNTHSNAAPDSNAYPKPTPNGRKQKAGLPTARPTHSK
jgi:hypothetical protein